jgi:hypothetical protein
MIRSLFLRLWRLLRDRFLLGHAEAIVRGYTPERHACIRQLHAAAMNRIALADESTDASYAPAAVTLYREAIRLLASALLVAKNLAPPGPPLDLGTAVAKVEELVRTGELPPLPKRHANAKALLETPDHLLFAEQDRIETARGRAAVEALGQWLRRRVEPRSIRRLWVARVARVSLAVGAALLVIRFAVPMIQFAIRRH